MQIVVEVENKKRDQVIIAVIRSAHGLARYELSIMLYVWRIISGKFDTSLFSFIEKSLHAFWFYECHHLTRILTKMI